MFRQDRTNPSTAVSNWKGRRDSKRGHPQTAVSTWLNGGLFGGPSPYAGYIFGGKTTGTGYLASGERFSFPDEVLTTIATALPATVGWTSGCSNNGTAGYTGAGYGGGNWPDLSKWMYATETKVDLTDLPDARYGIGTCGDTGNAGFIAGSSGGTMQDDADKITFATDARSLISNWCTANVYAWDASENDGTAGYGAGGIRATQSDVIDKFTFSTEGTAALSATLSTASYYTRATANQGTAMYICPGNLASSTVDKLAFSGDTVSTLSAGLSSGRYFHGMFCDRGVAVYASQAGGTTNYDRWALPSDTRSVVSAGSDRHNGPSSFSNANY